MNELVTKSDLALALEIQTYKLIFRLGGMMAVGLVAFAAVQRLY
jgi:hypothetical protein